MTTFWFYHKSSIGFHSTVAITRVRMGGSVSLDPAESEQKLFTSVNNGPSIILILSNSSNIALIGFSTEEICIFSVSVIPFRRSSSDEGSGVLKLEPQTFQ